MTYEEAKEKIEEIAASVSALKAEITSSQNRQDNTLADISSKVVDLSNNSTSKLLEISNAISNNYNSLTTLINNATVQINNTVESEKLLHSKVDNLTSATSTITEKLNSVETAIAKQISSVKVLTILAIVLSIISIVVNFIK